MLQSQFLFVTEAAIKNKKTQSVSIKSSIFTKTAPFIHTKTITSPKNPTMAKKEQAPLTKKTQLCKKKQKKQLTQCLHHKTTSSSSSASIFPPRLLLLASPRPRPRPRPPPRPLPPDQRPGQSSEQN
jgi:hypothetical protein